MTKGMQHLFGKGGKRTSTCFLTRAEYHLQKILGLILRKPIIPSGKTVGYSLVRSEQSNVILASHVKVYSPYKLLNLSIGDYSYIAENSRLANCTIGKFCSIGPNCCCGLGLHPTTGISTSPMFYSCEKQNGTSLTRENKFNEHLQTTIGNDVFIGANVTILDGVTISDGAVIGAGAVVTQNIPPYAVAVGVPAKVIKYRFEESIRHKLSEKKWWDGSEQELKTVERLFFDVETYCNQ